MDYEQQIINIVRRLTPAQQRRLLLLLLNMATPPGQS